MRSTGIIILLLNCYLLSFSQTKADIQVLSGIFEQKESKPDYSFVKKNTNEFQWIGYGLFLFYKTFISSQDASTCAFYPSCSTYALQSLKKNGLLIGTFSAFDRLTRCNPLSPEEYIVHPETKKFYDPVE
jgi:uncharacterized protein